MLSVSEFLKRIPITKYERTNILIIVKKGQILRIEYKKLIKILKG